MAATAETLVVAVRSDGITKANREIDNLGKAADNTEKKVLKLVDSVNAMVNKFASSVAGTKALTDALAVVNRSTMASDNAMKALTNSVTALSVQIGVLSTRIENSNGVVNTSTVNIRHHTRAMGDAHAMARGLTGSLGALWLTYGNAVPLIAGAALGASFKAVMKQGMEFENTLMSIAVKGQETAESIEKIRTTALELGDGIYGPQKVAEAMETLILAGLKAEDAVRGVGAALNLATVGGTEIEKAAYTLVQVGTAMGYTSDSFSTVGNVIAKTAATSMSSVESLSEAFKSASSVGVVYGVTLKDLAVNLATLSNLGIQGTAAGTAVKNFYKELDSGADRVVKTLAKVGVSVDRDLKVDGKFKDINTIVKILSDNLDKFGDAGGQALQKITNERGMRSIAAMLQAYRKEVGETTNAFADMSQAISDSAGMIEIGAARQAGTSKNLVESTINTMKKSFIDAFEAMAPSLNIVAIKLKEMFNSAEFKNGLSGAISGLSSLFAFIASNLDTVKNLAIAFLAVKTAMMAFSAATAVVAGLTAIGKAIEFATGATVTFTTVVKALQASFLPLLAVVTAVTAAMAFYSWVKKDALDTKVIDAATNSNKSFTESLNQQAHNLEVANDNLRKYMDTKKAASETNAKLALEEVKARNKTALDDAESKYKTAQGNLGKFSHPQSYAELQDAANLLNKVRKQTDNDLKAAEQAVARVQKASAENDKLSAEAQDREAARLKARADLAAKLAGNPTLDKEDKGAANAAKKALSFLQEEQLELKKVAAQYDARTKAVLESYLKGEKVAADSRQAAVAVNNAEGKYASNKIYLQELSLAKAADEAKLNHERAVQYTEMGQKISDIIEAEKQRVKAANDGDISGKLQGQIAAAGKYTSISKEQLDIDIARAKIADAILKANDERIKLEQQSKNSSVRAEQYMDQAKAMSEYGSKAKSTALDLAQARIAESTLTDATDDVVKSNYLKAASFETVAKALVNITRIGEQSSEEMAKEEADSLLAFADSEKKKVQIKADAQKKIIALNLEQARRAADSGDEKAVQAYQRTYDAAMQAIAQIDETTKLKMHNVELLDWKKTVDNIVNDGLEGFDKIAEGGGSIWKSLMGSFKSMFKTNIIEYIKKEFAKPFLLNVVTNVAGSMGMTGIAEAATAMGGGGNAGVGSAFNMYKMLSGGFDSISSGVTNAIQTGFDKLGFSMNSGAPGELASSIGSAVGSAAGIAAGLQLNKMISGQYKISNGVNTVEKIATVAAAYFGPIASGVVGAVSGLVNRAFGMGPKTVESTGIRGTVGDSGTTGEGYSKWKQKGGWFRSNKSGTDVSALGTDVSNTLTSGFTSIKSATEGFAKSLDIGAAGLDGFSKSFDIVFGTDAAKNQEAVTKFFTDLSDEMATKLIPNISEFSKQGETASQTLERLSNVFQVTDQVVQMLGKTSEQAFGAVGLASDKARERLVDMTGGISNLANKVTAYASAMFTDAEKLAPLQKALSVEMDKLGLSAVTTKDQFKAVVNGLDLTTDAGAKMFNSLMDLAPAFAEVVDAAADALKEAQEEAAKAAKDDLDNKMTALKNAVDRQKDMLTKSYNDQIELIKKKAEEEKDAAKKSLSAAQDYLKSIQTIFTSLENALKSTEVKSDIIDKARRQSAQNYLKSIAGTDLTKAGGLDGALSDIGGDSEKFFSTFEEYAMDQAKTATILEGLKNQAGVEKTLAELTVERLNDTIEAIEDSSQKQLDQLKEQHEQSMEALQAIVDNAQLQIDALNGLSIAVQTVNQALSQLASGIASQAAAQAPAGDSARTSIDSLYKTLLGRSADSTGMAYYLDVLKQGHSLSAIAEGITNDYEYKNLRKFDVGTNFVTEDTPAMVHQGERIMPKADNAELMRRLDDTSGSTNSEEIASLKAELRAQREENQAAAIAMTGFLREIAKTNRKWDNEGLPAERTM